MRLFSLGLSLILLSAVVSCHFRDSSPTGPNPIQKEDEINRDDVIEDDSYSNDKGLNEIQKSQY
jgi:hypothetical protein